jgi:RHS repeat-associated protein
MTKKTVIVFLSLMLGIASKGYNASDISKQIIREVEPISPQADVLKKFGEYPMDYSTGVPNISIPLYEIKVGSYTLPISISYHASGIKLQDVSSPIGLGWALIAGGSIIRQIKGAVDKGTLVLKSEADVISNFNRGVFTSEGCAYLAAEHRLDTESDRYSYNFNGKNGIFRYDINDMSIKTIPYTPLRIEKSGSGYMITDTDGVRYYFLAEEKSRGDFTYGGDRNTSAWYLTKIVLAERKDSIELTYRQDKDYYAQFSSDYIHQGARYYFSAGEWNDSWGRTSDNVVDNNSAMHTTESSNMILTRITWRGNHIDFSYTNDREDCLRYKGGKLLPRLTSVTVYNNISSLIKQITFDNQHYTGSSNLCKRMFLKGVTFSGAFSSTNDEKYSFTYNSTELPNYFNFSFNAPSEKDTGCHEDYWGYYNGSSSDFWTPKECMPLTFKEKGANRSVVEKFAKAGIIERITYPTGGYTLFDFESNRLDNGTLWGGLRIKTIRTYDSDATLIGQKSYNYKGAHKSIDNITNLYRFDCDYIYQVNYFEEHYGNRYIFHDGFSTHHVSVSQPLLPLTADYGFPIYYTDITEYFGDSKNNLGKAIYSYEESRTSDYNKFDDIADQICNEPIRIYSKTYNIDHGNITTLLNNKKVYKKAGNEYLLDYSEDYNYEEVSLDTFLVGVTFKQRYVHVSLNPVPCPPTIELHDLDHFNSIYAYYDVMGMPSYKRIASKTVKDYGAKVTTTTTYTYDRQGRTLAPKTERVTSPSGDYYEIKYDYPFDLPGYDEMRSANLLLPIQTKTYRNGQLAETTKKTYAQQNGIFVNTSIMAAKGGNPLYETDRFEYDNYGNLICATKNGTDKVGFVWSYQQMYPVAKVEGLSSNDIKASVSTIISPKIFSDEQNPSIATINNIVKALNNAGGLCTAYRHVPLKGLNMIQTHRGENTYYNYNSMNMLANIKDHNSRTIESYIYNYGTQNYVNRRIMTNSSGLSYRETTDFYDGLGRKTETVGKGQAPNGNDIVTMTEYDAINRPVKEWLPTAFTGTGSYVGYNTFINAPRDYYGNDARPFSQTEYNGITADRFLNKYGPGEHWHSAARYIGQEYTSNASSAPYDCLRFTVENDGLAFKCNGNFQDNELYVIKTTDEDNHISYTFTDKEGHLVLERKTEGTQKYDTYYIYDIYGNLCFVLPPAASDVVKTPGESYSIDTDEILQKFAYHYLFDHRNRCVAKKLPGCATIKYVYDNADRLIFSQDGNQRGSQWTFHLYDKFGREVVVGTTPTDKIPKLASMAVVATYTGNGGLKGYTCPLNLSNPSLLSVNYYDSYNFLKDYNLTSTLGYKNSSYCDIPFPSNETPEARGLLTGSWTAFLGDIPQGSFSTYYYGERERLVQKHLSNALGGYDSEYYCYDFTGMVSSKKHIHSTASTSQTELYSYKYDHAGRLLTTMYQLNSNSEVVLHQNTYDELGRLISRTNGGNSNLTEAYTYNVRSWPTTISAGSLFSETLYYDESHDGSTPQFGGNISAMTWKSDGKTRGYKFGYDNFSRLLKADYMENGSSCSHYTTAYSYDNMGNILKLKRHGLQDGGTYGLIDNLTFTYNGNQVTRIDDSVNDPTYNGVFNFVDGASQANEYTYDKNGNLTKDLNKKISLIQYNLLNLPTSIAYSNGKSATYIYDANGNKLKTTYRTSGSTTETSTDYCGNMIYENNVLKQILVDGGYITFSGSTPQYHYYLKDHLGNSRVVCSASGAVEQVNHYYPFGGLFGESTGGDTQRYKYNGKELDRMHGLDWYDYGARHMDGMRFTTIDPLAGDYYSISPYAYCANNPIKYVDKDGRKIVMSTNNSIEYNNQYNNAIHYLKEHGCSDVINYLENVETIVYIKEIGSKEQNYTDITVDNNEIGWKAKEGLLTNNGYKLSPAIRLFHELVHQEHKLRNPEKFLEDIKKNDSFYQSAEDESIIKNEETQAAKLCGEIPDNSISRPDHGGIPFDTENSTSRKILNSSDHIKIWQATWEENDTQ